MNRKLNRSTQNRVWVKCRLAIYICTALLLFTDIEAEETTTSAPDVAEEFFNVLSAHRTNYVLPYAYNFSPNNAPFEETRDNLQRGEVKFQFSIKARLYQGLLFDTGDLWLGYTNLSFWQAYDRDNSSPFRETNHTPELFIDFNLSEQVDKEIPDVFRVGLVHQSNGESQSRSRSWDRIFGELILEESGWYLDLMAWYRIPEDKKDFPEDPTGDENPDILDFLGHGQLTLGYRAEAIEISIMGRHNLENNNRFALQLEAATPLKKGFELYLQVFSGYGESLIDYNDSSTRIGLGFRLT